MRKKTLKFRPFPAQDSCSRRGASVSPAWSRWAGVMMALLALVALAPSLQAKKPPPPVTKSISGAVLDRSNNGISGASVMLTNLETHKADAMYTGPNGAYAFSGLNPNDDYQLQASYKNSVSDIRGVSSLDSRTEIVVNLVMGSPGAGATHSAR